MNSIAVSAPRNAAIGIPHTPGMTAAHITTASPAPALTPMTLGPASGLCRSVCIITPAPASPAPAISAASVRGSRRYSRIRAAADSRSPHSTPQISAAVTSDTPSVRLSSAARIHSPPAARKAVFVYFLMRRSECPQGYGRLHPSAHLAYNGTAPSVDTPHALLLPRAVPATPDFP